MTRNLLYTRVSDSSQSSEAQLQTMLQERSYDKVFNDEGVSGAVLAANRKGFAALLGNINAGDTLYVYAVDRLGRDAIDVLTTIKKLLSMEVSVHIRGLGLIAKGIGELIVLVMAQMAEMERDRIRERTVNGRAVAKASLDATGFTHRGKTSLGRPTTVDAAAVVAWRADNKASIAKTAKHFSLSDSTVKRYCAAPTSSPL